MLTHRFTTGFIRIWQALAVIFFAAVLSACTSLADQPVYQNEAGALEGHDPVAYFTEGKPVKGSAVFSSQQDGTIWYFSSAKNKSLFDNNPEKYSPQYGGYCAQAMAHGLVVSSDPAAFTIKDDKLFLNYSLGVRQTWLENVDANIKSADKEWLKKTAP